MKIKEIKIREDDGSYSDAIPIGVDFVNVDTTNGSNLKIDLDNINKDLDNKTNQIDNLKNKDISLQNQINSLASGSPKGIYANAAALKATNPDTGVYITTNNGHIYSWTKNSTGDPIDLGVYQAAEDSETINRLKEDLDEITEKTTVSYGKTINAFSPAQIRNDMYGACVPYYAPQGKINKINYYGNSFEVGAEIVCVINGLNNANRSELARASYTVTSDDVNDNAKWYSFNFDDVDVSEYEIIEVYIASTGQFITRITDGTHSDICAFDGDRYKIYYRASAGQGNWYAYTANANYTPVIEIFTRKVSVGLENLSEEVQEKVNKIPYLEKYAIDFDLSLFDSVGACGDSFTYGTTGNSQGEYASCSSWFNKMARRANVSHYANYGKGGVTTREYLTNSDCLPKLLSEDACDFYFLAFGINDSSRLGLDYLGTINDITDDYTTNPDTFYGNYARIIEQIKEHSPNVKMVLLPIWYPWNHQYKNEYNAAIKNIADHYGIVYINIFEDWFFTSEIYRTMTNSHPSVVSYNGMSFALERLFSKCVKDNWQYFKFSVVG